jgi:trehalose 6-phosphate phosphatase
MSYYDWIGFTDEEHQPLGAPTIDNPAACCFFIDFDGTLVEIAETPGGISIDAGLIDLLNQIYKRSGGRTAIVSGRRMEDLASFLRGFKGPLIGSHGAERLEGGRVIRHPAHGSQDLETMRNVVRGYLDCEPDVLLEDKPASFVLHFRQAPDRMADAEAFLAALVGQRSGWHLHHAKMALEVMPDDVSKGAAIAALMDGWKRATPVAIGDDNTDEAMFHVVQEHGGIGIKVGSNSTCARHCLLGVAEVHAFLRDLAEG